MVTLGWGQRSNISKFSNAKSISKIFLSNYVCVLTNNVKHINGIFILLPGSRPRGGTGGSKNLALGFARLLILVLVKDSLSCAKCYLF